MGGHRSILLAAGAVLRCAGQEYHGAPAPPRKMGPPDHRPPPGVHPGHGGPMSGGPRSSSNNYYLPHQRPEGAAPMMTPVTVAGAGPPHPHHMGTAPPVVVPPGAAPPPLGVKNGPSSSSSSEAAYLARDLEASADFDRDFFFSELKKMYKRKMLPLELDSNYAHFASPPMGPADFDAKPMVLLLGQYSVGKTSFIRALLGRDFAGQRIGPEPTTDRFVAVMGGDKEQMIPGNALAMRQDKQFTGLQGFGNAFLEKFQGAEVPDSPVLENLTLVDTPGVLSGEKQRARSYDFPSVVHWFAERSDLIILMFDAHKLDISDELRATIHSIRSNYAKIRVVLNKADVITPQQLLRVYGALMWQLGRVMATPEVVRVHLGAFNRIQQMQSSRNPNEAIIATEMSDLLSELHALPRHAVLRRINDLSKRGRCLKVHCYLIHYLRKQMPMMFGKSEKRDEILRNLPALARQCCQRYGLSPGDLPNLDNFQAALAEIPDLKAFPKLDKRLVAEMDNMFAVEIPKLLERAATSKI